MSEINIIEYAMGVILDNSKSIKEGEGSSYTPDSAMIIHKAIAVSNQYPHINKFLKLWEADMINVQMFGDVE